MIKHNPHSTGFQKGTSVTDALLCKIISYLDSSPRHSSPVNGWTWACLTAPTTKPIYWTTKKLPANGRNWTRIPSSTSKKLPVNGRNWTRIPASTRSLEIAQPRSWIICPRLPSSTLVSPSVTLVYGRDVGSKRNCRSTTFTCKTILA